MLEDLLQRRPYNAATDFVDANVARGLGDKVAFTDSERSLTYALGAQTKLGLLPEQVTEDGEPAWVVPLAWSHAMLLLAARPELALLQSPTSLASAAWA